MAAATSASRCFSSRFCLAASSRWSLFSSRWRVALSFWCCKRSSSSCFCAWSSRASATSEGLQHMAPPSFGGAGGSDSALPSCLRPLSSSRASCSCLFSCWRSWFLTDMTCIVWVSFLACSSKVSATTCFKRRQISVQSDALIADFPLPLEPGRERVLRAKRDSTACGSNGTSLVASKAFLMFFSVNESA